MQNYSERPKKAIWLKAALLLAVAAIAYAAWMSYASGEPAFSKSFPVLLGALIFCLLVMCSYWMMEYRIRAGALEISVPPFSYRIARGEIAGVRMAQAPWWMGVGIKLGWKRIAFTTRRGNIVEIEKKGGFFERVLLTPNDPEEFIRMLR